MTILTDTNILGDSIVGLEKIDEVTLLAAAASISFTVPQHYRHLKLMIQGRTTQAAAATSILLRFNGDAGANYDYQYLVGSAAAAVAAETFGATSILLGQLTGANAAAGIASAIEVGIQHYSGATYQKTIISRSAVKSGTATTNLAIYTFGGFWRSTAAITTLLVVPVAGNLAAATIASLYGVF